MNTIDKIDEFLNEAKINPSEMSIEQIAKHYIEKYGASQGFRWAMKSTNPKVRQAANLIKNQKGMKSKDKTWPAYHLPLHSD